LSGGHARHLLGISGEPGEVPPDLISFVVAITRFTGRWVLVRVRGHEGWEFPGGKVDSGETPEAAVRRELHEETGIAKADIRLAGWYSVGLGKRVSYGYLYTARALEAPGILPAGSEIEAVCELEQLPGENTRFPNIIPRLFDFAEELLSRDAASEPLRPTREIRTPVQRRQIIRDDDLNLSSRLRCQRRAVRAVIFRHGRLLLIHSPGIGDYKFPGGGVETGENPQQALAREIREESGYGLSRAGREVIRVDEYRRPRDTECELFVMESRYFFCELDDSSSLDPEAAAAFQRLDDYEAERGMKPVWISPADAMAANRALCDTADEPPWNAREIMVLQELIRQGEGMS
jgi:8-oxo-dGTP diphosphatase